MYRIRLVNIKFRSIHDFQETIMEERFYIIEVMLANPVNIHLNKSQQT